MQIRYFRRGHAQISMIFRDGPGDDSLLMLPIRTEKQHGFAPADLTTEALNGVETAIRQIGLVRTDKVDKHSRQIKIPSRACGLVGYDVALTRRRSPVRIRPGPSGTEGSFFTDRFIKICLCRSHHGPHGMNRQT